MISDGEPIYNSGKTSSVISRHSKIFTAASIIVLLSVITVVIINAIGRGNFVAYETKEVTQGSLTVTVTATGALEPINKVDVGSELSGIVETVDVDYNDRVKKNQVLARLDTSKLDAQAMQSKAALESARVKVVEAQATVDEARSELERMQHVKELSNNMVPSKQELVAKEAALRRAMAVEDSLKAQVSQARATLESIETDLIKSVIRSPINGIVLTRSVEPGQTVAATFQTPVLFTLAEDLTKMELHVDVNEADVGMVQEGQEANFTVDAYSDRSFPARITQVRYGAKTVEGVVTYETLLSVDNKELVLRPGMTATAEITVKKIENALLVPNACLRFSPPIKEKEEIKDERGILGKILPRPPRFGSRNQRNEGDGKGGKRVWTLLEGRPSPIAITTGATDGVMTELTGGDLKPGMVLITSIANEGR
ncbi:Periplasmic component of efflux system [uncultured Desulfobacterium sp.]|uniref:Periplasmic component of efflux system n=1 Tax=uncultured Desulfobacterium sp. TaxID=201089 RepID=A0A445MV07_9BACT|nr:Periplasmic component of efflux system [uncultured Desulfobacterium sp.]